MDTEIIKKGEYIKQKVNIQNDMEENKNSKEKFFSKLKNKNKENKQKEDDEDISNNQILYGNRKK